MADIRPFAAVRFAHPKFEDVSKLIAPPYDVLDDAGKAALTMRDPHNIVTVDLPFMPPKSVGPDAVYQKANATIQEWIGSGVLARDKRSALYPYSQTYTHGSRTFHRRGFFALVKLSPFGAGDVVPHEKTYKGPIEDRLKLMHATGMQLSPIFGLFNDPSGEVTKLLYANAGKPEQHGALDGVTSQLWSVIDAGVERQVIDLMKDKPVYIADGHHRYTTALQYKADMEAKNGGPLPADHPANYCLFDLVSMQNDGLLILATHRMIGGMKSFDVDSFRKAVAPHFELTETALRPDQFAEIGGKGAAAHEPHTFGLFDGKTRKLYSLKLINLDLLKPLEAGQSEAWRSLDVAILQRFLLDEILQPKFAGGEELVKGYTADDHAIAPQVDGNKYQIAIMLRPTPLQALVELGKHKEVMPQKSTYFFPKLATGMVINSLR